MVARTVVVLTALRMGACAPASATRSVDQEVLTLEVGPRTLACTGEGVRRCLQVRYEPGGAWTNFYDPIEGFTHVPGYHYRLEVARRRVADPPADGSSYAYRLLRVVSRNRASEP